MKTYLMVIYDQDSYDNRVKKTDTTLFCLVFSGLSP